MKDKSMLVLLAGGYSTRLGLPKHTIKSANGDYLFEGIIKNVYCSSVTIITNRAYVNWWNVWLINRGDKLGKRINIIVEPHDNPEAGKTFGPTKYLTNNIPMFYGKEFDSFVVAPIDSYYEKFDFIKQLEKANNAIVVASYPDYLQNQLGTVGVSWRDKVKWLEEKSTVNDRTHPKVMRFTSYVFTGMLKLKTEVLQNIHTVRTPQANLGNLVQELINWETELKAIKCKSLFRDVGIEETYRELLTNGKILANVARIGEQSL